MDGLTSGIRLRRSSPLTAGLVALYAPGVSFSDLTGQQAPLQDVIAGQQPIVLPAGLGYQTRINSPADAGLTTYNGRPTFSANFSQGASLWFWRQYQAPPPAGLWPWLGGFWQAGNASDAQMILFSDSNQNDVISVTQGGYYTGFARDMSESVNGLQNFVLVDGGDMSLCLNGTMSGRSFTFPGGFQQNQIAAGVHDLAIGTGGNAAYLACGVWNRRLSDDESRQLCADPMGLFEPSPPIAARLLLARQQTAAVVPIVPTQPPGGTAQESFGFGRRDGWMRARRLTSAHQVSAAGRPGNGISDAPPPGPPVVIPPVISDDDDYASAQWAYL